MSTMRVIASCLVLAIACIAAEPPALQLRLTLPECTVCNGSVQIPAELVVRNGSQLPIVVDFGKFGRSFDAVALYSTEQNAARLETLQIVGDPLVPRAPQRTILQRSASRTIRGVGIGTATPAYRTEIATGGNMGLRVVSYGGGGAVASFAANGDSVVDAPNLPGGRVTIKESGNVGIGTTAPQYRLSVNGTIGAREVIVTNTSSADYVFKPGYRLRPLSETAAFIKEHGRLPDIPSEKAIKENGVGLGQMQVKLLGKIEELTLQMIQMDARNNRLERQNRELQERLLRLEGAARP